jgi:hypothetical protein
LLGVGVEQVQTDASRVAELVSEASEVLRSSSLHPMMMSEAVTHVDRSIVIVTSDGVACSS